MAFDIRFKRRCSVVSRDKREGGVNVTVGFPKNCCHQIGIPSHMLISLRTILLNLNGFKYYFLKKMMTFDLSRNRYSNYISGMSNGSK